MSEDQNIQANDVEQSIISYGNGNLNVHGNLTIQTGPQASDLPVPTLPGLNPALPIFVEIQAENGGYAGSIHQGDREQRVPLGPLALGPDVKPLPDLGWTLARLMETIRSFDAETLKAFDARAQLDLGRYFYAQTLERLPEHWRRQIHHTGGIDLRVMSDDEWIAGLPWSLLAERGVFLSAVGWSISLAQSLRDSVCVLPPSPRILLIAPQPEGQERTFARRHLEELEELLSEHDPRLTIGDRLRLAVTWREFLGLTEHFQPQIVYYYGHGVGDMRQSRLLFAEGPLRQADPKPLADFALALRRLPEPPLLAYLNCCLGDAGGFLGAGLQLGEFIPAVLSNRTVAQVKIVQAQALSFWRQVLLQAVPPHRAAASLYRSIDLKRHGFEDIRWFTPVLHCRYSEWQAQISSRPDRLSDDQNWHLKIDRTQQYSIVMAQTALMLREQKPKSLVFVWYGREGDGVEIFHKRLSVELKDIQGRPHVYQVRPRWPEHLEDYHSAFSDVLCEAFEVNSLEAIPQKIRAESHGKQTLVYVRHEPARSSGSDSLLNPKRLKEYVRWWNTEFAPKLEGNQFALLTVSFLVNNPPKFQEYVEDENIETLDTRNTVFWLLNEMETLAKKDLRRFVNTHNIDIPEDRLDRVLDKILQRTGGRYELTIEELKQIRREAWREDENDQDQNPAKKTVEY